jgi:hypothetical protein
VVTPPIWPMLARLEAEIPLGGGWVYEPKWDGFRWLIFKNANSVHIGSRNRKSLDPYFPELVAAALRSLPEACVVDGEIVVARDGHLDFQALLERLDARGSGTEARPAAPACFVAFDLLAVGEVDLRPAGFGECRRQLEGAVSPDTQLVVTPQTQDPEIARGWLEDLAARGFEGDRGEADLPSLPIRETSDGEGEALAERRSGRVRLPGPSGGSLVLAPRRLRRARGPASRRPDRGLLPPRTCGAPSQASPPRGGSELRRRADAWPDPLGAPAV